MRPTEPTKPKVRATTLQNHHWWLSERVEGPNITNVFKRTFYQMMFKFQLGHHEQCAGCVLAVPQSCVGRSATY